MRLVASAASDVGRVREGNEDSFVIDSRIGLFAVADGMGGHQAGEIASATALESLRALIAAGRPIRDALEAANTAVYEKAASKPGMRGMGTTVTAVTLAAGGTLFVGHVGDSRAYLFRDGALEQITADHSLVEELVREGRLTPEQASAHPQRSIITRALGIDAVVEIDVYTVELRAGDRLLLCSDGLTTMVQPAKIAAVLRREVDPTRAAEKLVEAANAAGGEDNITTVVADVVDDGDDDDSVVTAALSPAEAFVPAIPVDATAARPAKRPPRRVGRRVGRSLVRVLLFALPVIAVAGIAVGAVGWYARRTFYVAFSGDRVTVYRGVPDGLLGWDPTIEQRSGLTKSDLTSAQRADLDDGHRFSTRSGADAFVRRLEADSRRRSAPTTTAPTTTAPTTTTAPAGSTTTTTVARSTP